MEAWVELVLPILVTAMASSGFWAFIMKIGSRRDATTQLLLGLAHHRIITHGMHYTERGWITKDEYQNYMKYLYEPYKKFGGNGLAERVAKDVASLKIVSIPLNSWKPSTTEEPFTVIAPPMPDQEQDYNEQ